MNDSLQAILAFMLLITAPIWLILVGALIFFAIGSLYFLPAIYGVGVYFIYGGALFLAALFYILGKRTRTEIKEIHFYTPSFIVKKERR